MIKLEFDESKEMEFFINFHGAHILRINTTDSDIFLKEAKIFDSEVIKNLDSENRCKIIYIVDKLPPLSAVLTFVQSPFSEVSWGAYAVITPKDESIISKFIPVVSFGLNMTELKNKYAMKVFDYENRDDLTEVFNWLKENESKKVKD